MFRLFWPGAQRGRFGEGWTSAVCEGRTRSSARALVVLVDAKRWDERLSQWGAFAGLECARAVDDDGRERGVRVLAHGQTRGGDDG